MSYWYEPEYKDLSLSEDKKELYAYIDDDNSGAVYVSLKVEDVVRLLNKIK